MVIKNKLLLVIVGVFSLVGLYTTLSTIYDSTFKNETDRYWDEYYDGFRGGAYSYFRMESAELDSEEYGKEVEYSFVEDLARKSLKKHYPESKDWDSVYYDGFVDGYVSKYVYTYYNGE